MLLGTVHLRCHLHGEVRLVFAREHAVGHLVKDLRELARVMLADSEDNGLPNLAADRVAQGIFEEGFAEELVGGLGEESLLKLPLLERLAVVVAFVVLERDDETIVRKKLRGDGAAGIDDGRVDEEAILDAIKEGVAEGGLAVVAAKGAVGIEHETALELARVFGGQLVFIELLEVVERRGGEAKLVADKVIEHGASIATDGAVSFVRDDEVEIGRRKELLVFVIEEQRLDGGDDDLGVPPVVAIFFVDDALVVVREDLLESLERLVFEFEPVHEEDDAAGVAGAEEELDDGGGGEGLAGARGHFEQKAVAAFPDGLLNGIDGFLLVEAEEAEAIHLDEAGAFAFVLPSGFRGVARALGEDDIVILDNFLDEALRVRRGLLVAGDGGRRRERRNDIRVAAFEIPEVMEVAVGENDEAAVLRLGVFACLLLAHERTFVLGLGFEDDEGERLFVEQQEVDEALTGFLEVLTERVEVLRLHGHAGFELDVRGAFRVREEAPTCVFEQLVDLDAGGGFFHAAKASSSSDRARYLPAVSHSLASKPRFAEESLEAFGLVRAMGD